MERCKLNVIAEPEEEKIEDGDSKNRTELANSENMKFQTDKVNYAHKVLVSCVKRNHTYLCGMRSIICHNYNKVEYFAKKIDLKETSKET